MIRITIERFCTYCMANKEEVPAVVSTLTDRGVQFLACREHEEAAISMGHTRIPIQSKEVIHEE